MRSNYRQNRASARARRQMRDSMGRFTTPEKEFAKLLFGILVVICVIVGLIAA